MGLFCAFSTLVFAAADFGASGGETHMTPSFPGDQVRPAISLNTGGGIMAWHDNASDGVGLGISAMRLNAALGAAGGRMQINAFPEGDQENAQVALLSDGTAFIVWQGGRNGFQNVYARVLNADNSFASGNDILISEPSLFSKTLITTNWPLIRNNKARQKRQRFRCVIENRHEFAINPVVTALSDGSLVVAYGSQRKLTTTSLTLVTQSVWNNRKQKFVTNTFRRRFTTTFDSMQDVYFQRVSAAGEKLGAEQVANGTRDYNQRNAALAALPDGRFVLCWISEVPVEGVGSIPTPQNRVDTSQRRVGGGRIDVFARVFDSDGTPAGTEWKVNSTDLPCVAPSIAALPSGSFTVAWTQRDILPENGWDVYCRTYDASGSPADSAARANTHTAGDQFGVSALTLGQRQLLVWSSMGQDGSWEGVYARWLQGSGPASDEFRVNTTTRLRQIHPAAAANESQAAIIWSSYAFESGFDLFLQRYRLP